jgi:hypothetical protein
MQFGLHCTISWNVILHDFLILSISLICIDGVMGMFHLRGRRGGCFAVSPMAISIKVVKVATYTGMIFAIGVA